MHRIKMTLLMIFVFSLAALSKDEDLKSIYTTITNSINSAILTKKGNWELSGSAFCTKIETSYKDEEAVDITTIYAEPALSYFIINNLALGLCFSYNYENFNGAKTQQRMFGVIAKNYFGSERWRPFVFADYLLHGGDNYKGGELNAGAGLLYHLAGNFGIKGELKYGIFQSKDDSIEKRNGYYFGIGIVNFIF